MDDNPSPAPVRGALLAGALSAVVAAVAEQLIRKQQVNGSNPFGGSSAHFATGVPLAVPA